MSTGTVARCRLGSNAFSRLRHGCGFSFTTIPAYRYVHFIRYNHFARYVKPYSSCTVRLPFPMTTGRWPDPIWRIVSGDLFINREGDADKEADYREEEVTTMSSQSDFNEYEPAEYDAETLSF